MGLGYCLVPGSVPSNPSLHTHTHCKQIISNIFSYLLCGMYIDYKAFSQETNKISQTFFEANITDTTNDGPAKVNFRLIEKEKRSNKVLETEASSVSEAEGCLVLFIFISFLCPHVSVECMPLGWGTCKECLILWSWSHSLL